MMKILKILDQKQENKETKQTFSNFTISENDSLSSTYNSVFFFFLYIGAFYQMVGYMYTKPHFARILHQNTPLKKAVIFCGEAYFKKIGKSLSKIFQTNGQWQPVTGVLWNSCSEKIRKIHMKTLLTVSLLGKLQAGVHTFREAITY